MIADDINWKQISMDMCTHFNLTKCRDAKIILYTAVISFKYDITYNKSRCAFVLQNGLFSWIEICGALKWNITLVWWCVKQRNNNFNSLIYNVVLWIQILNKSYVINDLLVLFVTAKASLNKILIPDSIFWGVILWLFYLFTFFGGEGGANTPLALSIILSTLAPE